jgi:hypothetical protein
MGSFQVCDALSILFKLEKLPIEHLQGFIFLPNYKKILELLTRNFCLRIQKNTPIQLVKVGISMVEGIFAVATMSC